MPGDVAARGDRRLTIPTIGIGAGADCDGQVLVWQDMGRARSRKPRFVKQYADLRTTLDGAARAFASDVAGRSYPGEEHTYH